MVQVMSDRNGAVATTDKPTYLGLLNAIALAESRAHRYLMAWAGSTSDAAVRHVLQTVAWREGEHGMAFAKRINELGFELRDKPDPRFEAQMELASSQLSDLEKLEKLGLGRLETDVLTGFDTIFKDHSIDIRTGELLGRYIAEEHDSARLLRGCYQTLQDRPSGKDRKAVSRAGGKSRAEPTSRRRPRAS
jgi:rubrerythrin